MHTFQTSRDLPYSPTAVFAAFADSTRLARWWGPEGFYNTFDVCDFQPGGSWKFTMHGPDGQAYPNESVFGAIEPGRKVVIHHIVAPRFELTVELAAVAGGTRVSWVQVFEDAAVAAAVRHIVEPSNEQNLDRLTAEVAAG
ncbi:MAG: hypothetical protein RLZZ584_2754 [Pseudomonadota bacterium]|jgi:uncharacterized protein YndB with AHSA1/START domain